MLQNGTFVFVKCAIMEQRKKGGKMNEQFCKNLKAARKKRGYTQDEVSKETGIARPLISKYENGLLEPNIETLKTLIDFYEVSADWLLGTGMTIQNKEIIMQQMQQIKI